MLSLRLAVCSILDLLFFFFSFFFFLSIFFKMFYCQKSSSYKEADMPVCCTTLNKSNQPTKSKPARTCAYSLSNATSQESKQVTVVSVDPPVL